MIKISGVYKIINCKNKRMYIGSSVDINKRINVHFRLLNKNKHDNNFLQNDFNKHGKEVFKFEVILITDCLELLLDFEQNYIDEFFDNKKNCYNMCKIAGNTTGRKHSKETINKLSKLNKGVNNFFYGKTHSVEAKEKISKSKKGKHIGINNPFYGKKHTEKSRIKISQKNKNKKHSEETINKLSKLNKGANNAFYGKKHTDKVKEKISITNKGKQSGKNNYFYNNTIYHFIHKTGIEEYCTQYELRKKFNLKGGISALCNGRLKSYKGWKIQH